MEFLAKLPAGLTSLLTSWQFHLGLGALILVVAIVFALRFWSKKRRALEAAVQQTAAQWRQALRGDSAQLHQQLETDEHGFVCTWCQFHGATKIEYEQQARPLWSSWLAQCSEAERLLKESTASLTRFHYRPWWQIFSLKKLKRAQETLTTGQVTIDSTLLGTTQFYALAGVSAARTVDAATLPELIIQDAARAQAQYNRFALATRAAREVVDSIRRETHGRHNSISSYVNWFQQKGLSLTPFQNRLDELGSESEQFIQRAAGNPLSDYSSQQSSLKTRLEALTSDLSTAYDAYGKLDQMQQSIETLKERVDKLRSTYVEPGFKGVRRMQSCFTLDEEGFSPDVVIPRARKLVAELEELLKDGQLQQFAQKRQENEKSFLDCIGLVDQILADQAFIDRTITAIDDQSNKVQAEVDADDRSAICDLYKRQKWTAARSATERLHWLHEQRRAALADAAALLSKLDSVNASLKRQSKIVANSVQDACNALAREAKPLAERTAAGRADWQKLRAQIAATAEKLTGDTATSITGQIKTQLVAYEEAQEAVERLRTDLNEAKERLSDQWLARGAIWLKLQPVADAVFRDFTLPKQDWVELKKRAEAASVQVRRFERDKRLAKILKSCESQLQKCQRGDYTRTICGAMYGAGVFCATAQAAGHLQSARANYESQNLDALEEQLQLGHTTLGKAHLEAWWLTLQAMSMSSDPCAQAFALDEGYMDCGFDSWVETHLKQLEKQGFYEPSSKRCSLHTYGEYEVTQRIEIDWPSASDYEGGASRLLRAR